MHKPTAKDAVSVKPVCDVAQRLSRFPGERLQSVGLHQYFSTCGHSMIWPSVTLLNSSRLGLHLFKS